MAKTWLPVNQLIYPVLQMIKLRTLLSIKGGHNKQYSSQRSNKFKKHPTKEKLKGSNYLTHNKNNVRYTHNTHGIKTYPNNTSNATQKLLNIVALKKALSPAHGTISGLVQKVDSGLWTGPWTGLWTGSWTELCQSWFIIILYPIVIFGALLKLVLSPEETEPQDQSQFQCKACAYKYFAYNTLRSDKHANNYSLCMYYYTRIFYSYSNRAIRTIKNLLIHA